MLRLRPYKSCDSKRIADWIKNEETFVKWGGERFGSYPINAKLLTININSITAIALKMTIFIL